MASSVNSRLLSRIPILKHPSDVLTFGSDVSIIASSTMNFVMWCLVPPGDVNQLTINAGLLVDVCYASKRPLVLTVPRALSRIHRITKYTLKMADIHFRRITRKVITEVVVAVLSLRRMVNLTTRCIFWSNGGNPSHTYRRAISRIATTGSA
ncbi:hypothetical protein BvCmsNSP079_01365 [Escherichia coli]|nr:hypothetical protein BvCmsNSP079_01365 [Escherichia coli]GDU66376.1 hypothetical protein BvCmsSIP076_02897 [Escherichia coli]